VLRVSPFADPMRWSVRAKFPIKKITAVERIFFEEWKGRECIIFVAVIELRMTGRGGMIRVPSSISFTSARVSDVHLLLF